MFRSRYTRGAIGINGAHRFSRLFRASDQARSVQPGASPAPRAAEAPPKRGVDAPYRASSTPRANGSHLTGSGQLRDPRVDVAGLAVFAFAAFEYDLQRVGGRCIGEGVVGGHGVLEREPMRREDRGIQATA